MKLIKRTHLWPIKIRKWHNLCFNQCHLKFNQIADTIITCIFSLNRFFSLFILGSHQQIYQMLDVTRLHNFRQSIFVFFISLLSNNLPILRYAFRLTQQQQQQQNTALGYISSFSPINIFFIAFLWENYEIINTFIFCQKFVMFALLSLLSMRNMTSLTEKESSVMMMIMKKKQT